MCLSAFYLPFAASPIVLCGLLYERSPCSYITQTLPQGSSSTSPGKNNQEKIKHGIYRISILEMKLCGITSYILLSFSFFAGRSLLAFAWDEPLLAAVVPDPDNGLSVLQVLRLSGAQDGGDDCLCSAVLHEDSRQPTGTCYWCLRGYRLL